MVVINRAQTKLQF